MNDINTDIDSLRTKCSDATKEEAQEIWQKIETFLEGHPKAKGLAAIQLVPPIYKRVIVINEYKTVEGKIQLKGRIRMLNPKIVKATNPITIEGEGCLSLPKYSKQPLMQPNLSTDFFRIRNPSNFFIISSVLTL